MWNDVARECIANQNAVYRSRRGRVIDQPATQFREVARLHQHRRDGGYDIAAAIILTIPIPGEVEEALVTAVIELRNEHRAANRHAEFILPDLGFAQERSTLIHTPTGGIELVIAQKIEHGAVQIVRPALGDEDFDTAAAAAIFR